MNPSNFWYIKLRDYGDRSERKKPAEQWGGYSIEFDENDNVYSYDETQSLGHNNFAIVGRKGPHELVVIDVDCHDIEDFDASKLVKPSAVPTIKSIHPGRDVPGFHFYILISQDSVSVKGSKSYVDIKANSKGHVVSPWHNDQYQIVDDKKIVTFQNVTEANKAFSYGEETLLTSKTEYSGDFGSDWDPPEEAPVKMPFCLQRCLQARRDIPRDGSHPNPWKLDSATGRRIVAHGYSKEHAMRLMEKYPPQDGFDGGETAYQLDLLYQKQLHPESNKSLRQLGILGDEEFCSCWVCDDNRTEEVKEEILDAVVADEIYTHLEMLE